MNYVLQEDLSPALTALREGLEQFAVKGEPCKEGLALLCAEKAAYRLYLILEQASLPATEAAIWQDFHLSDHCLQVQRADGALNLHFSRALCKIQLRDYPVAPIPFAPYHNLRDRIVAILTALEEKHHALPHLLTPNETRFLPLCGELLGESAPPSPEAALLLQAYKIYSLPIKEDAQALALLKDLEQLMGPDEKAASQGSLFIKAPRKLISFGLRTRLLPKGGLYCTWRAVPTEGQLRIDWGISTARTASRPEECALDKGRRGGFYSFSLPIEKTQADTLSFALERLSTFGLRELPSLIRTPQASTTAVFGISIALWSALAWGASSLLCAHLPLLSPLSALPPLLCLGYGALRWLLYAVSRKL